MPVTWLSLLYNICIKTFRISEKTQCKILIGTVFDKLCPMFIFEHSFVDVFFMVCKQDLVYIDEVVTNTHNHCLLQIFLVILMLFPSLHTFLLNTSSAYSTIWNTDFDGIFRPPLFTNSVKADAAAALLYRTPQQS